MLNHSQIKNFEKILLEKKQHLEEELNRLAVKNEEGEWEAKFNDLARDDETNANEVEEFANDSGVVNTLSKDLKNVEIALQKITTTPDIYGKCETCSGDINPKRLEILPEARNCMKCK